MTHLERLGLLDILKHLAEGIVAVVGPHCEVVVHDFSDLEHSAVVVAGNVSGREPGAPVPDLDFISTKLDRDTPDQLNYRIKIDSRELQSSTIWLRDSDGSSVGAVCINVDYAGLLQARTLLEHLTAPAREVPSLVVRDTLAKNLDELIELSVSSFLRQNEIPRIEMMSQEDKLRLVAVIEEHGLFQLRGAAQRLADILNVSRASIYNYRASIRREADCD
ncbi:MAG: PAS domain-containing protein [Deltaproteobacteria bacterium]|nr:PAS domain-containing protein [Deltaproteobacteria bacterium]